MPADDAVAARPGEVEAAVRAEAPPEPVEVVESVAGVAEPAAEVADAAPVRRMAIDDEPVVTLAPTPAEAAPAPVVAARRGGPWLAIAWVVSVLAVLGGVAALVVWREALMTAWPPSIRAYAAMGLAARP